MWKFRDWGTEAAEYERKLAQRVLNLTQSYRIGSNSLEPSITISRPLFGHSFLCYEHHSIVKRRCIPYCFLKFFFFQNRISHILFRLLPNREASVSQKNKRIDNFTHSNMNGSDITFDIIRAWRWWIFIQNMFGTQ